MPTIHRQVRQLEINEHCIRNETRFAQEIRLCSIFFTVSSYASASTLLKLPQVVIKFCVRQQNVEESM